MYWPISLETLRDSLVNLENLTVQAYTLETPRFSLY